MDEHNFISKQLPWEQGGLNQVSHFHGDKGTCNFPRGKMGPKHGFLNKKINTFS